MKILFAANRFPYPPYRGDKLKIYNLAKQLSPYHELHLLTFLENEQDEQYVKDLEPFFSKIILVKHGFAEKGLGVLRSIINGTPLQVGYFFNKKMVQQIADLDINNYDAIHIQHLRLIQYWEDIDFSKTKILDLPDAYSLYWDRRVENSSGLKKMFNKLEFKRVLAYEKRLNKFTHTLVCSKEDAQYLQKNQCINNVNILPNGVDVEKFYFPENTYDIHNTILFTGNMDYEPNIDAVEYFVNEIFPIILTKIPQAIFIIAGQRPVKRVLDLANEQVRITGFIPKLEDVYKQATIVVAPLRFGAGTQNKVLEAMASGIPVISRNIGFEGLDIKNGEGVFLEMTTDGFAQKCIELLLNSNLRQEVGTAGLKKIKENFDWKSIAHLLLTYIHQ